MCQCRKKHRKKTHKLLEEINGKVDKLMADVTQLENVIDQLAGVEVAVVAELKDLTDQIGALEVGNITQDQVDALTDKAQSAVEAIQKATTDAQAAAPDEPPAPTPEGPVKAVYTAVGSPEGVDTTQYTPSGFETVGDTPETLYYFEGDVEGGEATGAVEGVYEVFTGETQAVGE